MFTLCMSRGSPPLQDNLQKNNVNKKKQIKSGYLLRYKRGFLCKGWSEEWVVLYQDSTLAWYADKSLSRLRGFVQISEAPEMLAVGEWTRQVPGKPRFPRACHIGQLLAVGCRTVRNVHWLMGQTPAEINDWMTAISNTLPPPPNEKRLTRLSMANGHANPVPNGVATIISNGKCPTPKQNGLVKAPTCSCEYSTSNLNYAQTKGKKSGKFDNDHTILAGVCVDWGHGYGWTAQMASAPAVAPQISFGADTALYSSALYCHTGEDFTMSGGYDDADWSAFGDFCF